MRQKKFTKWLFPVAFSIMSLLFAGVVMAGMAPPVSCNTFTKILSNGNPDLSTISSNPVISIDNAIGDWPIVIASQAADMQDNVCDNRYPSNYPCTVFKYNITPNSASWQSTVVTIPTCLDNSMDITTKYSADSACKGINSSGNPDWASFACGMRDIRITGGNPSKISIPVKGTDVGIGIISMTLTDHTPSQGPNINYFCYNIPSDTGILGPSCQGAKKQPLVKLDSLCTVVEGQPYLVKFVDGVGKTAAECADTSCTSCPTVHDLQPLEDLTITLTFDCPASNMCDDITSCISGSTCTISDQPIKGFAGLLGDISNLSGYMTFHDSPGCTLVNFGGTYLYKCN